MAHGQKNGGDLFGQFLLLFKKVDRNFEGEWSELHKCTNVYQLQMMLKEGIESSNSGDVYVDILEFPGNRELKVVAKEDPDATENSSSFDDTNSGYENTSGLSDVEVESQFFGDSDLTPPFDGFGSVFPMRFEFIWHFLTVILP